MFSKPLPPLSAIFLSIYFVLSGSALLAQSSSSTSNAAALSTQPKSLVDQALTNDPWEFGPFFNGGVGASNRSDYTFLSTGVHLGKIIGSPFAPGLLHGQFEMAGDIMPWWQGRTPNFLRANCYAVQGGVACGPLYPTGGAYNGISITPVIFRWNFLSKHESASNRWLPFIQGAGGVIWTNHKYPPVGPYQQPNKQGTSVWNFTPQFGVGIQYFLKPKQSLTFQANAVHISSASLGDTNPGVNASVQFTVGYTWWK
jgi:lipid A 3-O-deacylase